MWRPGLTVVAPIILIGVIASVVALLIRQQRDPQFAAAQNHLATITPPVLAHFIASAPDPRPGTGRRRGTSARCSSAGAGELRNPWTCTVTYPVGPAVRYRVIIAPTGEVQGASRNGSLLVSGCCVGYHLAH